MFELPNGYEEEDGGSVRQDQQEDIGCDEDMYLCEGGTLLRVRLGGC